VCEEVDKGWPRRAEAWILSSRHIHGASPQSPGFDQNSASAASRIARPGVTTVVLFRSAEAREEFSALEKGVKQIQGLSERDLSGRHGVAAEQARRIET
jgi:hypothetical protein